MIAAGAARPSASDAPLSPAPHLQLPPAKKASSLEGARRTLTGECRPTIYFARRAVFFVFAFALVLDLRTARFFAAGLAAARFAGRATLA